MAAERAAAAPPRYRGLEFRKYLSITCVIRATSREQLDNLYQELCDHPMVVMVL